MFYVNRKSFHLYAAAMFLAALSLLCVNLPSNDARASEPWDVVYDGVGSAADNVPNWLRWDSAIDDDWDEPDSSFQLDAPAIGYMSVDRVTDPNDHNKTGNIWIRDPVLSSAAGFTMEVAVKINSNSNTNAFSMTYLDDAGSFGVHLSPNRIKVGDLAAGGSGSTVAFNTTDDFHTYRIVKQPNSYSLSVYVDGSATPIISGSGNSSYAVGSSAYLKYPRVLIGDNENNLAYNANYVLDFVQYRRGATSPGQTPPVLTPRVLPSAPVQAVTAETWTNSYEGNVEPLFAGWIQGGGSVWTSHPGGIMELKGTANARLDGAAGWSNQAPITIEARIKVMSDSDDRGFNIVANDQLGGTALVLSADKVELMHNYMPVGAATVLMDTTDDFHVYRFVRDADGLYWHLYIDDNPAAAIAYQHSAGDLLPFSRIWFGDIGFPEPGNSPHVLIDYIRWHEGALAPIPEPAACLLLLSGLCGAFVTRRPVRRCLDCSKITSEFFA